jgi:hypothetical protein
VVSDGALMDVTPTLAEAGLKRDGDGMAGLLIMDPDGVSSVDKASE